MGKHTVQRTSPATGLRHSVADALGASRAAAALAMTRGRLHREDTKQEDTPSDRADAKDDSASDPDDDKDKKTEREATPPEYDGSDDS